jgi:hypothetical protein
MKSVFFPLLSFSLFHSSSFSSAMLCHLLFFWPNFFIYSFLCIPSVFASLFQAVAVWLTRFTTAVCYTIRIEVNIWKVLISVAVHEFSAVNYCLWKDLYVSSNCVIPLIRLYFVIAMMNNKSIQFNTTSWVKQPVCGHCSVRCFTLQNRPSSSGSHFCASL